MKCFRYSFGVEWGAGQGVVFAETRKKALDLVIKEDTYSAEAIREPKLKNLQEVNVNEKQLLPMSWSE